MRAQIPFSRQKTKRQVLIFWGLCMRMLWKSAVAGVCASTGASALKLAVNGDNGQLVNPKRLHTNNVQVTIGLYALFLLANILMWWLQLGGFGEVGTTAQVIKCLFILSIFLFQPIIVFTGMNFVSAGILGWLMHGEQHDVPWLFGLVLVLIGVIVVQSSNSERVKRG
jgi:hypothetical protein